MSVNRIGQIDPSLMLGLHKARYVDDLSSEANVGLALLKKNDVFYIRQVKYEVLSISQKSLILLVDGKKQIYGHKSMKMWELVSDVREALVLTYHGVYLGAIKTRIDQYLGRPMMATKDDIFGGML
jgi:hypothetical protein